jgi:hypothetical protein
MKSKYELGSNSISFYNVEYLAEVLQNRNDEFESILKGRTELTDSEVVILKYVLLHRETNRRFYIDIIWDLGLGGYYPDVMTYSEIIKSAK